MPQVIELEGEAIGALSRLIVEAFDRDDLKMLLRVKLNFDIERELDMLKSDDILVFNLILKLQKLGIIVDFLRYVIGMRPQLRDQVGLNCPLALEAAPDAASTARVVAAGLGAVQQKLDDPTVRLLVTPHRDELERLMDGIEVLTNYKRLHDSLQTIQLTHQPQMASDMQRLRSDEIAGTTLDTHVFQLDELCRNASKAAEALPNTAAVQAAELRWVNKLKVLIDQIRLAVGNLDDREGMRAMRALRLLLRPESYRINNLLVATADGLPLEQLVSTVADVVKVTSRAGATPAELRDGLQSLQSMLPKLKGQVAEHNQWQEVEMELFAADDFLEQGTPDSVGDFQGTWTAIKQSVAALAGTEPAAAWSQKSQNLTGAIDAALPADMGKVQSSFAVFRHTLLFHFFQVDRALRYQCEAISAIRAPLKSLLNEV